MALPTSYTEAALKTYADGEHVLGKIADIFRWTVAGGDYDEIVNDALGLYGENTIANITGVENVKKLRAATRVAAWRAALQAATVYYDYRDMSGNNWTRSQLMKHIKDALALAESDAQALDVLDTYEVDIVHADYAQADPYSSLDWDDRELWPNN